MAEEISKQLLQQLRESAQANDLCGAWPADDLDALAKVGAMQWVNTLKPLPLHMEYYFVASASLATALILTQRDSAVAIIASSENSELRDELIPKLDANAIFTTVGIAQLTTSRQGRAPALRATQTADGYVLEGIIPWCTGAAKADVLVAGASLDDGRQILFALPKNSPGMKVDPPLPLVALRATWTSEIHLQNTPLPHRQILRGPVENVLSSRKHTLPAGQAFLALGHCKNALELITAHDSSRARAMHERFESQLQIALESLLDISGDNPQTDRAPHIRANCNKLALRITHSAVTLYKGTALLASHPAQRLAREAMFLLVWSCPDPVIDCTVDLLSD